MTGKKPGRGAYLCDNPACWTSATSGHLLEKALRTTLTRDDLQRLEEYIKQEVNQREEDDQ